MVTLTTTVGDHAVRLAAGQACLDAARNVYLPQGFSIVCCCDPDHVGVGRTHAKTCTTPGKTPMHAWKALQTQLPTAIELEQRWREFPYGNVRCVLGQVSGLVRVDVDGPEGEALLLQWSADDLPATWSFRSSPQGRGLVYRWPRDLPCKSTAQARPGGHAELRLMANGSQTILPPSRHPSGSRYTWEPGHGPDDIPLAPAPAWLVERLRQQPRQHTPQQDAGAYEAPEFARVASALAAIPNQDADYDTWLTLGMALHSTAEPWARDLWDGWSRQSDKFDGRKQEKSWHSFSSDGTVTIASLFHLATQAGWKPPRATMRFSGMQPQTYTVPNMTEHGTPPVADTQQPQTSPTDTSAAASHPQPGSRAALLKFTKDGRPRALLSNILDVLEHDTRWKGALAYNELTDDVTLLTRPPYHPDTEEWQARPMRDADHSETSNWLQREYDLCSATTLVAEGLQTFANRAPYHPIRQYLASLTWDGTKRLDTWLGRYCHAADTSYTRAIGRNTLISAVARVQKPGCKVDTVTILEGPQGSLKSTVWRLLAGDAWFSDSLPDLHSKDGPIALRGKWVIELGELAVLQRSEVEAIKRFISATQDHYRPAYGHRAATFPRQNVFVGSTNRNDYFKDDTGNRRFWPVAISGLCDIEALQRDRDQLWAEAFTQYCQGEQWHLTPVLEEVAMQEQAARVEADDWEAPILEFLNLRRLEEVTTHRILTECFHFENPALWTPAHSKRIGAILRRNGWRHQTIRTSPTRVAKGFKRVTT